MTADRSERSMATGSSGPENLESAAHKINEELARRPNDPMTLSPRARKRLMELHAEFLSDLGQESIRTARRMNVDTVDEFHVDQASSNIGAGRGKGSVMETATNAFGGVFAGAGIAAVYAIVFTPGLHSTGEMAVALVLSVIGFVLLTIGLTSTFLRRRR